MVNDPQQILQLVGDVGMSVLRDGLPALAILVYLFVLNWKLTLMALVVTPLMAFVMKTPWFFKLWGIPFVLVGLYMMVGRFYVDARRRAATFQGITSTSLLFISGRSRRVVQRIPLRDLGPLSLQERGDGSGVIGFSALTMGNPAIGGVMSQIQQFVPQKLGNMHVSLEVQEDVRGVYRRLRDAIEEASRS